jgi:hypothetical protein
MFKAIDKRCIRPPTLLSSKKDPETLKRNITREFMHGINDTPFSCASIAVQWKIERAEKWWTRLICYQFNLCAIQSIILEFLQENWFFPSQFFNRNFNYRLTAKMGLNCSLPDYDDRRRLASTSFEFEPWI